MSRVCREVVVAYKFVDVTLDMESTHLTFSSLVSARVNNYVLESHIRVPK
jgi:hypothetical protein